MKRKGYSKYKQCGVEWLGEVPGHWEALPLRRMVKSVKTGGTPTGVEDSAFDEEGFNWYAPGDFTEAIILGKATRKLSEEGKRDVRVFPPMTVMLVGIGATIGKVGLSFTESACNQQINGIICSNKLEPKFATFFLKTLKDFIVRCGKYTTLPIINQEETKNLIFTLPPLPEQQAIAAFLDRETSRIDSLLSKKLRLIDLLKEKRTALISRAVTKGLYGMVSRGDAEFAEWGKKSVKYKPSGVDDGHGRPSAAGTGSAGAAWLGEVPEGWEVKRIVYLLGKIQDGTHFSPDSDFSGEFMYITAKNIKEWGIDLTEITYVTKEVHDEIYRRCPVKKGDVLYIKDGATAGIATVNKFDEQFSMLSSVALLRPKEKLYESRFLAYHLNMESFKTYVLNSLVGGAMTRFTIEIIRKFMLITPPLPEQKAIAAFLDRETAKLDALVAKVETVITKLKEYRTALISAAVTGKIDVREAA